MSLSDREKEEGSTVLLPAIFLCFFFFYVFSEGFEKGTEKAFYENQQEQIMAGKKERKDCD